MVRALDSQKFLKKELFFLLNEKKAEALNWPPLKIIYAHDKKKRLHRLLILLIISVSFNDP